MKRIILVLLSLFCLYPAARAWEQASTQEIETAYGALTLKKGSQHCGVERVLQHTPEGAEHKLPLIFLVIHGTYASHDPQYYQNYATRLQICVQQIAIERATPVKVVYYRWSGFNTPVARTEAGEILAKIIDKHEGLEIITIAHSHGGTVVNYASNHIKNEIEVMVHYAVPVIVENELFRPNNFKLLCNFYSLSDIVQLIGATSFTTALKASFKHSLASLAASREYTPETVGPKAGRVVNIRTRYHGYETDHSAIKNAIAVLPHVLDALLNKYLLHHNLELNIDITQKEHPVLLMAKEEKNETEEATKEASHSLEQKELYKARYGKEIGTNPTRLSYFSEIVTNTLLLIPTVRNICQGYNFDRFMPQLGHLRF